MTPELVVSVATFVIVFLVLGRLGRAKPAVLEADPDVARARDLIRTKIDEHEIEGFIGNVLLREIELEQPGLGPAVREVVTLEREHVYELVLARVQAT
jgi:hypothetical protein